MIGSLRDYSDIYVAACCRVLGSYAQGVDHESYCGVCRRLKTGAEDETIEREATPTEASAALRTARDWQDDLGTGAPHPIFLDLEDGLGDVDVDRTPLLTDFGQFMEASSFLVSAEHPHKTVVVDTVDWLERLVHRDVARAHNKTSIEEIPYGKGYMLALDKWDLVLSTFEELRRRGLAVILLAHARIAKFNDPTTDSYDRYEPDLHKTVAGRLMEWCDEVLFATYAVRTVKQKEKFNAERVRAIGSGERVVFTCEMPTHLAKRRCELPDELPLEFAAYVEHVRKASANGEGDIAGVVVDGSSKKREAV